MEKTQLKEIKKIRQNVERLPATKSQEEAMRNIQSNPPIFQSVEEPKTETSNHLYAPVLEVIEETLKDVIDNAGGELDESFIRALSDVTRELIEGVTDADGDLEEAAESIILGTMRAATTTAKDPLVIIRYVSSAFIHKAAELTTDMENVVRGLIIGTVRGAKEFGLDPEAAVSQAAVSIVDAAFEVNVKTGNKVVEALAKKMEEAQTVVEKIYNLDVNSLERIDTGSVD